MKIKYNIEIKDDAKLFIENFLSEFDTSQLDHITISHTKTGMFTGRCFYPSKKHNREKYFIRIGVPTKIYPYNYKTYVGVKFTERDGVTYSRPIEDEMTVHSIEDSLMLIFGHEIYHFLRKSRQVGGKNTQSQANAYGFQMLQEYHQYFK